MDGGTGLGAVAGPTTGLAACGDAAAGAGEDPLLKGMGPGDLTSGSRVGRGAKGMEGGGIGIADGGAGVGALVIAPRAGAIGPPGTPGGFGFGVKFWNDPGGACLVGGAATGAGTGSGWGAAEKARFCICGSNGL